MAYISRQQAIDQQNRARTTSTGSVDGGGTGPTGSPQAPSTSSGNATGIRDYLRANQVGAARLGEQVAGYINKETNDVGSALGRATQGFEQQAAQRANTWNQTAVDRANATGDTSGISNLLAGGYSGPRSLSEAGTRAAVDTELAQAKEKGELAKTMGGRVQLLREMSGRPQETGVTRLDAALLGGNATSANALKGAVAGIGNLDSQISSAEQMAAARAAAIEEANAGLKTRTQDTMAAYAAAKLAAERRAAEEKVRQAQAAEAARLQAEAVARAEAQARANAEAQRLAQEAAARAAADAAAKQAAAPKAVPVQTWAPTYESFGGGDSAGEGGGASDGGIGGTAGSGNDGGDSGGDAATAAGDAGGGGGGGGGKIICTAMAQRYGLDSHRTNVWLRYSKTHLKPEHQKGYHFVFLPLVKFGFNSGDRMANRVVRRFLEWMAISRTTDIQNELAGLPRNKLHRALRSVAEPALYLIGRLLK